jgi:cobalt-zinc-cadmium efflux system protein
MQVMQERHVMTDTVRDDDPQRASQMDASAPHSEHDHGHDLEHTHGVRPGTDRRYLLIALALLVGFMLFEVVLGFLASSLALLSDAGHMLTDVGALVMALVTMRLAAAPAQGRNTFGLKRAEILSAQANGVTLVALAALFAYEAIRRIIAPPQVEGGLVLIVALVCIGVNLAATWALARANRQSLNVEGSFQHILTDLYAFIATAVAGALILLTHLNILDALASLVVAGLMLRAGIGLLRESTRVLLEAVPAGLEPERIGAALAAEPGVARVHDLHVWEVTSGFAALAAHVHVDPRATADERNALLDRLTRLLVERFQITHSTLQLEADECVCNRCDGATIYCAHAATANVEQTRTNAAGGARS